MPPGPLAVNLVDPEIIKRGILPPGDLYPQFDPDIPFEDRKYAPPLGEKLRLLFDHEFPGVHGVFVQPVWSVGDLLEFGCDFHKYISGRDLAKQEGLIFRHILRLILLLGEFSQVVPPGLDPDEWRTDLRTLADRLTDCCKAVDPQSTEYMLAHAADVDVLVQEPQRTSADQPTPTPPTEENSADDFGGDILDSE